MSEIANTILAQLGGRKFLAMTGAKNLMSAGDKGETLSMKLPARFAKDGINCVLITLTPADTYRMKFVKMGRAPSYSFTMVAEFDDVYADSLREVFTRATGLDTSLGTMKGGA